MEEVLDAALTARVDGPPVFGITGLQGCGKSTLASQVVTAARDRGLRAETLSIDDVYLTREARRRLAREIHPLLITRGPPGTHDLPLALETLDAARAGLPVRLPRFDKLADDRVAASELASFDEELDLLIFEGWFLKTPPEDDEALRAPINALEREEDPDGRYRRHCNEALGRDYPPLWRRIDSLLFLAPPSFEMVFEWRLEQERALGAARPGAAIMSAPEVERFVQHFERVSRRALRTLPAIAERTVRLDARRRPR